MVTYEDANRILSSRACPCGLVRVGDKYPCFVSSDETAFVFAHEDKNGKVSFFVFDNEKEQTDKFFLSDTAKRIATWLQGCFGMNLELLGEARFFEYGEEGFHIF